MMVIKALISMFSILLLASCSSVSVGPIDAGPDSYVISKEQSAFSNEEDDLLASILLQANEYCLQQKRYMEVKHLNEYTGFFGNDIKTTLVFSCLSEKEQVYQQLPPAVIVAPAVPVQTVAPVEAEPDLKQPEFLHKEKLTNYAF